MRKIKMLGRNLLFIVSISVLAFGVARATTFTDAMGAMGSASTDYLAQCKELNDTSRYACEAGKAIVYSDFIGLNGIGTAHSRFNSQVKNTFQSYVTNSSVAVESAPVLMNTILSVTGLGEVGWKKAVRGLTSVCENTCPANFSVVDCSTSCGFGFLYLGASNSLFNDGRTIGLLNENAGYEFGKSLFQSVNGSYGDVPAAVTTLLSTAIAGKIANRFGGMGQSMFPGFAYAAFASSLPVLDRVLNQGWMAITNWFVSA